MPNSKKKAGTIEWLSLSFIRLALYSACIDIFFLLSPGLYRTNYFFKLSEKFCAAFQRRLNLNLIDIIFCKGLFFLSCFIYLGREYQAFK